MEMSTYLKEIEHAASVVLAALWHDHEEVAALANEVERLSAIAAADYRRAGAWMESDDPEDMMLGVGMHWETYFGTDKERGVAEAKLAPLEQRVLAKTFSRAALAGSLLQFAKQGIAIVHHGLKQCPDGRKIGSQAVKSVIWQGRNQSLHWEEQSFNAAVEAVFNTLAKDVSAVFKDFKRRNLAFEVVDQLGWKTYDGFRADLRSLA
jgi:hypothetical protein